MVEVEWMLPLTRFRVCSLFRSIGNCWMDNLRPSGALRWKVGDRRLGMSGSVIWQASTSKIVAPHVSVKDRWVGHVSKYWTYRSHADDMGPVSLVLYHQQELVLSTLLQWLCWERNWDGSRGPLSWVERWSWEHFFSEAVHPSNPVEDSWKVDIHGPHEVRMVESHTWTEREKHVACWSGFPLQGVHRFESSRLLDISNHLFVAVFT
jgi:hypothetical protein